MLRSHTLFLCKVEDGFVDVISSEQTEALHIQSARPFCTVRITVRVEGVDATLAVSYTSLLEEPAYTAEAAVLLVIYDLFAVWLRFWFQWDSREVPLGHWQPVVGGSYIKSRYV